MSDQTTPRPDSQGSGAQGTGDSPAGYEPPQFVPPQGPEIPAPPLYDWSKSGDQYGGGASPGQATPERMRTASPEQERTASPPGNPVHLTPSRAARTVRQALTPNPTLTASLRITACRQPSPRA